MDKMALWFTGKDNVEFINTKIIPAIEALENHKASSQYVLQLEGCINTLESRIAQLESKITGNSGKIDADVAKKSPINEKVDKCEHDLAIHPLTKTSWCVKCTMSKPSLEKVDKEYECRKTQPSPTPSEGSLAEKIREEIKESDQILTLEDYEKIAYKWFQKRYNLIPRNYK